MKDHARRLGLHPSHSLSRAFHAISTATWSAPLVNFAHALATNTLAVGKATARRLPSDADNCVTTCPLCGDDNETVRHLLCDCSVLDRVRRLLRGLIPAITTHSLSTNGVATFLAFGLDATPDPVVSTIRGAALETIRVARARRIAQWHDAMRHDGALPLPPLADDLVLRCRVQLERVIRAELCSVLTSSDVTVCAFQTRWAPLVQCDGDDVTFDWDAISDAMPVTTA